MRKLLNITMLLISAPICASNYVGLDYQYRAMRGRDANNYAMREVIPSHYQGFEVYAAHRFSNDVGLSLGWEQSRTVDMNHTFVANETFLGAPQAAGNSTYTQTQIRALNIDVNGYASISNCWEAIGQLGASFMQSNMEGTLYAGGVAFNLAPGHSYQPVPRIGLGLQFFCTQYLGLRVIGHWTGTNMFHQQFTDDDGVRRNIRPFTQSWSIAAGIVGRF